MNVIVQTNAAAPAPRRYAVCYEGDGRWAYGPTQDAALAALRALVAEPVLADRLSAGAADALARNRAVEGDRLDLSGG